VSAFALHPIYAHLPAVEAAARSSAPGNDAAGTGPQAAGSTSQLPGYHETQARLNAAPLLNYEAVIQYKLQSLHILFAQHADTDNYRAWTHENMHWLEPYAAFCCRRDGCPTPAFYYFVQYHLHLQLSEAVEYAGRKGIAVKGDLPIGLNLQSADVAAFPALFHTGLQAGAPPDDFAEKGQNWGFPTYNWPAMEAEGYSWWKKRLRHMAQYFSAFRIDHILGFFRIWQIPRHAKDGLLGYFEPALPFTKEALHEWGIPFSRERYCEPYITDAVLYSVFSMHAVTVKAECMEPVSGGHYRLLPAYRTQAAVLEAGLHPAIEEGLLSLLTNVLFLEPEPGQFHPRFNLHATSSFEALNAGVQQRLAGLADHFFYHRHNQLWEQEALRRLPMLQSATDMLVCGEDLGMVPHCVPGVMAQLGILSLEVQYMPKQAGRRPADAPYLSVVTPSTHDMPTLREWQPGGVREVLAAQLASPAMWCIPQLQDWLALDPSLPQLPPEEERINNPAVMPWYWRYRMPLTLEALLQAQALNAMVAGMIRAGGR
jgi:4-alpha-glucanotransferase